MVCTLGDGRMAAMVRLLKIGTSPEISAEEANIDKITAQMIHRQFHDADEANLLEEEDMHVFDSRPLTDPLHLVCCNACKKPIKASQYAAHAERCVSLNFKEEVKQEFNSNGKHKKPLRKGREKLQAANIEELENAEHVDGNGITDSESNLDKQSGLISSLSGEAKSAPIPLATKIYHLQGNHCLRLALGHLYQASVKDHGGDSKGTYFASPVPNPDQMIAHELCLKTSKRLASTISSSSNFQENGIPRLGLPVDTATVGLMRTSHRSALHSYSVKSGPTLGTMQKADGSVPVL